MVGIFPLEEVKHLELGTTDAFLNTVRQEGEKEREKEQTKKEQK